MHLKNGVAWESETRYFSFSFIPWGKSNKESMSKKKAPRLAMSLPVLKLLKVLLVKTRMLQDRRRLIWAVGCMAFHGSFCFHELLSREEHIRQ